MSTGRDSDYEVQADNYDALLDDALADFKAPHLVAQDTEGTDSQPGQPLQAFHPLPPRNLKKSSGGVNKQFKPLPDRAKDRNQKKHTAEPAAQAETAMPASGSCKDLNQDFARLMAELDMAETSSKSSKAEESFSKTLREMAQQSAEFRGSDRGQEQQSLPGDVLSEPMFAGLQEQFQGGEGGFKGLADTLMRQLLAKDVLYQPMKDIGERYPEWLSAHRGTLSAEEMNQYEEQYKHIQKILSIYENDPENFGDLFTALQEMQACGQPPQDIVNDLAPGMAFDDEGLPNNFPGSAAGPVPNCCIQ